MTPGRLSQTKLGRTWEKRLGEPNPPRDPQPRRAPVVLWFYPFPICPHLHVFDFPVSQSSCHQMFLPASPSVAPLPRCAFALNPCRSFGFVWIRVDSWLCSTLSWL